MLLYLDCCCYNRPFDDDSNDVVRVEAEAVLAIFDRARRGVLELAASEALAFELTRIPDSNRLEECLRFFELSRVWVEATRGVKADALKLVESGFGVMDAAHLAAAKHAGVDAFITVDYPLLRRARLLSETLGVRALSPVAWLLEAEGINP
jgi:predicted nucleic acid-binding protein